MGTIKVGQKNPKTYQSTGFTTVTAEKEKAAPKVLVENDKNKLIEEVMKLPVEERVAALRKAGLSQEADEYETVLADEHLRKMNEESRARRLAEIRALPEDEQLPLLIDEGFEDEAKELSEKLALGNDGEKTEEGNGEENDGQEENVDSELSELSDDAETEKPARPKAFARKSSNRTRKSK